MLTVSKLARRCGLSRGTLLYYESIGLLGPEEHQEFLEFLHVSEKEIRSIRAWSQKTVTPWAIVHLSL